MSAWNGVYEPSSVDGDACCACNSPAEPAKYVAGVGLLCLECFQAEFEPNDEADDCCPGCGACPGFIGAECEGDCEHALKQDAA